MSEVEIDPADVEAVLSAVGRLMIAVTPALLSLLVSWLVMEGRLDLGAGCKDVLIAIPLLIWSILFFLCYLELWRRKFPPGRIVAFSAIIATGGLLLAWLALLGISMVSPG